MKPGPDLLQPLSRPRQCLNIAQKTGTLLLQNLLLPLLTTFAAKMLWISKSRNFCSWFFNEIWSFRAGNIAKITGKLLNIQKRKTHFSSWPRPCVAKIVLDQDFDIWEKITHFRSWCSWRRRGGRRCPLSRSPSWSRPPPSQVPPGTAESNNIEVLQLTKNCLRGSLLKVSLSSSSQNSWKKWVSEVTSQDWRLSFDVTWELSFKIELWSFKRKESGFWRSKKIQFMQRQCWSVGGLESWTMEVERKSVCGSSY